MIQTILTIVIVSCATVGMWLYVRNERQNSCACGGTCSQSPDNACSTCALKQQCNRYE